MWGWPWRGQPRKNLSAHQAFSSVTWLWPSPCLTGHDIPGTHGPASTRPRNRTGPRSFGGSCRTIRSRLVKLNRPEGRSFTRWDGYFRGRSLDLRRPPMTTVGTRLVGQGLSPDTYAWR
jgi:hypothetical protein